MPLPPFPCWVTAKISSASTAIYHNAWDARLEFGGSINSFSKTKFIANYRERSSTPTPKYTGPTYVVSDPHNHANLILNSQINCGFARVAPPKCDFCLSKRLADASSLGDYGWEYPVCILGLCICEHERESPTLPIGRHN